MSPEASAPIVPAVPAPLSIDPVFPEYMPGTRDVAAAFRQRLDALADALLGAASGDPDDDGATDDGATDGGATDGGAAGDDNGSRSYARVVDRLSEAKQTDELWLALTVMSTVFASERLVLEARRTMAVMPRDEFFVWLLTATARVALHEGRGARRVEIVSDAVVIDVDGCARSNRNTGIQRVVRETMPRWAATRDIRLIEWNDVSSGFQDLPPEHRRRTLEWASVKHGREADRMLDPGTSPLVVPWRSRIVLPEVCTREQSAVYEAIGRHSGNTLRAIGYDCIPVVSPEVLPPPGGTDFLHYIRVLREADVVAPISRAAGAEFAGFFASVAAQRRPVPRVVECELAGGAPPDEAGAIASAGDRPLLVAVGSHEPRKNHLAVLQCAEMLWREGLDFELMFVGGAGFGTAFDVRLDELIAEGRPVSARQGVSDAFLWKAYRTARFTLFPSLHEGYGLPVAESIASGTPVITTRYGSTQEIAERGGALLVDPRSDDELHRAMRSLLVDEQEYARLREECRVAALRTWDDYADDLWQVLVESTDTASTIEGAA